MFETNWSDRATDEYNRLREAAERAFENRAKGRRRKSSKQEGLFKQVHKTIRLLLENPRHPSLQTHPYQSLANPVRPGEKVFEAYAQQHAPAAYRVFWCYGPGRKQITIIAITAHS
ncbi:MAG: hypothetical protein V2A58_03940 [Planctomycetota bacterium]